MKKLFLSVSLILFTSILIFGQMVDGQNIKYGNEWINFNQIYYKIPIAEDGIYHIKSQHLANAGIDLSAIPGNHFRLIRNGEEINIFTSTEDIFGSEDYIEFIGNKNKGEIDSFLYRIKGDQLNPEYSMFNDTAAYFLTWNNQVSNKRYAVISNDLSGTLPSKEEYYYHIEKQIFNSDFNKPLRDSENHVLRSNYDTGEGYGTKMDTVNKFNINTYDYIETDQKPELSIRFATNNGIHSQILYVNGVFKNNFTQANFNCENLTIDLQSSEIKSTIPVILRGTTHSDILDRNSVSMLSLRYARKFKFLNSPFFKFNIENTPFNTYYEIEDFDIAGSNFVLYDITNKLRLVPAIDNNQKLVKFRLITTQNDRDLILVNLDKSVKEIESLKKMEFIDYTGSFDKNYLIITNKDKFDNGAGGNVVDEYIDYRQSSQGGSFKVIATEIQNIYDQFGYGINRHSQAMNNFIMYYKDFFTNPEYVLVIGKGLEYPEIRTYDQLEEQKNVFIIPTYGYPGSDNLMASRLNDNHQNLAIGRIAARDYSQLETYLNKVKKYEDKEVYDQTLEDKQWMKKIIHLVGGDANIITTIKASLEFMGNTIKNSTFGGFVHTYERTSGTAQESVTQIISDDINNGASMVTFFGHSGVTGTDFNITNLQNNRYPVFYSLGCYSGNIHTTVTGGQSEEFILNDGYMIAYIGTSGTGFVNALSALGRIIYNNTGNLMYGQSLGKILKESVEANDISDTDAYATLNQQFTFHGDPAVSLYTFKGPDFLIDYQSVKVNPSIINSNAENFTLSFDVVNIGSAISDTLPFMILRTLPSGKTDTTYSKIEAPGSRSNVELNLKTFGDDGTGENCIAVYLNYNNALQEKPTPEAFNNNQLEDQNGENKFCFYIINNGVRILFPQEFSIVNKKNVSLQAATYNYFLDDEKYIIQIDTTELYNSPLLKQTTITSKGGLIKWDPGIDLTHNTVYYWRITPDSLNEQVAYNWSNSSFVFLENSSEGWNQSHYFQWLKDGFDDLEFNGRRLDYSLWNREFKFEIKKFDPTDANVVWRDGGSIGGLRPETLHPALVVCGYGPREDFYWNNSGTDYGSKQWKPTTFIYKTDNTNNRKGIKDVLEAIPDSTTIMIYTFANGEIESLHPEDWESDSLSIGYNIFSVLESYGAEYVRLLKVRGTVPYLFVFKKGGKKIFEDIGKTANSIIETSINIAERYYEGSLNSTIIGPAKNWNKILWQEINKEAGDESMVKITKLNSDLTEQVALDSLNNDYEYDISSIDAEQYPFLKLDLKLSDLETSRTTPDFNFWRVLYEGYPDAVLINDDNAYFYKDTLDFGDKFKFKSTVFNSSQIDMDSLLVKFKIKKENNQEIVFLKRYQPLKAGSSFEIEYEYPSNELAGINEFSVEINADKEQEEMYYFNNYGIKRFYVRADDRNPIMDVTFDGVHIMDGDIINPKPLIKVSIVDDNQFQLLDDISIIKKLTLVYPGGSVNNIDLSNNDIIEFIPATSFNDNKALLNFNPDLYEEGEYQLIVQTTDISGNLSGMNDYKISFKVIFKEQISEVYNYPNPFSTKTRFVFTLTGKELPKDVVIKIMTLSGKIVRELTSIDLGGFKYGINITDNFWDGTDEYGRLLANGIYLYEVTAVNAEGKEYEKINSDENTDKFFKKGLGKLVILR